MSWQVDETVVIVAILFGLAVACDEPRGKMSDLFPDGPPPNMCWDETGEHPC